MNKTKLYQLVDNNDLDKNDIFVSSLTTKQIKKIERQAEKEYQIPKSDFKSEIFFDLMKKADRNFRVLKVQEIKY